jgi:hypothetical protein
MDYKIWSDDNVEELATLLVSRPIMASIALPELGREACEAAMKMSHQASILAI